MSKKNNKYLLIAIVLIALAFIFYNNGGLQTNNSGNITPIQGFSTSSTTTSSDGIVKINTPITNSFLGSITPTYGNCTPDSPYDACQTDSFSNIGLTAVAKLNTYNDIQGRKGGYYLDRAYWGGKMISGTRVYYAYICRGSWDAFWANAKCNENGCQLPEVSSPFEYNLATSTKSLTDTCPVIVVNAKASSSRGTISISTGWGWMSPINIPSSQVVDCVDNSDCSGSTICQTSTHTCITRECNTNTDCGSDRYCSSDYKCLNNTCVVGENCNGNVLYECIADNTGNSWFTHGLTLNKCGVECLTNSDVKCVGDAQATCNNNVFGTPVKTVGQCGYVLPPPVPPTFDIGVFFSNIISGIINFFKGLFGG